MNKFISIFCILISLPALSHNSIRIEGTLAEELMLALSKTGRNTLYFEFPYSRNSYCELRVSYSDKKQEMFCSLGDIYASECPSAIQKAFREWNSSTETELSYAQVKNILETAHRNQVVFAECQINDSKER